jgi:hypothetical protein
VSRLQSCACLPNSTKSHPRRLIIKWLEVQSLSHWFPFYFWLLHIYDLMRKRKIWMWKILRLVKILGILKQVFKPLLVFRYTGIQIYKTLG